MDTKFRIAAEAAARAELLIDAKAVAGWICNVTCAALARAGGPRRSIRLAVPILRSTMASWIIGEVAGEGDTIRTNSDRIIMDPARNCTVGRYNLT